MEMPRAVLNRHAIEWYKDESPQTVGSVLTTETQSSQSSYQLPLRVLRASAVNNPD